MFQKLLPYLSHYIKQHISSELSDIEPELVAAFALRTVMPLLPVSAFWSKKGIGLFWFWKPVEILNVFSACSISYHILINFDISSPLNEIDEKAVSVGGMVE